VEIPIGQAEIVASFNGQYDEYISVLAFGSRVQAAVDAAEAFSMKHEIGVRVVNMRFVKPLDTQMLDDLALSTSLRSEEHTSELQSRENLVCRLLLEKKNKNNM